MIRPVYLTALVVVVSDQLSKLWALQHLSGRGVAPLLPGLLQQRLVFNTGAAFSMLEGNAFGLGLVSAAVAVGLVWWIQTSGPLSRWQSLGLGLLLGGAIGNGLDRMRLGSVVDFLEFVPIQFPVFNLADTAINLAVVCLLIDLLRRQDGRHDRPAR
ncbi:signal peptidase II [Synechococcus sp. CB0101]|jgi:signal peptidase II|uniref:signal peptidase II n=1 Tax=Synechococcus sp. CB0101 TaxID=232348 RepID=UPI0002002EB6|nr:signal peptidase II [Synechococcus sp. CB0101]QCH14082.1 signal peptidase II [Synechococcus sp. CB0101]